MSSSVILSASEYPRKESLLTAVVALLECLDDKVSSVTVTYSSPVLFSEPTVSSVPAPLRLTGPPPGLSIDPFLLSPLSSAVPASVCSPQPPKSPHSSRIRCLEESDFTAAAAAIATGSLSPSSSARYSRGSAVSTPTSHREQLDIDTSNLGSDSRTTLMIRNLPKSMGQQELFSNFRVQLEEGVDFIYMPYDANKNCNFGYVFLQATSKEKVGGLYRFFQGRSFNGETGVKACQVAYARLQGKNQFIAQFNKEAVLRLPKVLRPIIIEPLPSLALYAPVGPLKGSPLHSSASLATANTDSMELSGEELEKIAESVAAFVLPCS
jgi:hypothetical protein